MGMDEGMHLSTCLAYVACVMAFVACVTADEFSVMFLISLHWLCTGMDEACALVHALCSSSVSHVPWPLQHVWMFQCLGWVQESTRHAAQHAASVHRVCHGLCCGRHRRWMLLPKVVICAHTQHTRAIWNNNLLLQIACNNHARL